MWLKTIAWLAIGGLSAAAVRAGSDVLPAATVSTGLWTVHQNANTIYFELPAEAFGVDILVKRETLEPYEISKTRSQLLKWERRGNAVALLCPTIRRFTDAAGTVGPEDHRPQPEEPVAIFPLLKTGKRGTAIVDVSSLFTRSVSRWFSDGNVIDPVRSTVEPARVFPQNIVMLAALATGKDVSALTRVRWNLVRLPSLPMQPRLWDRRFGQKYVGFDEGVPEPLAMDRLPRGPTSIESMPMARWRLEKKYPQLSVSDPVKPIAFYIDPATPLKWRPYVRRAIEAWRPALEAAGFSNAVVAKDAADDPQWAIDDVRYSTVFWTSPISVAEVSLERFHSITDPRTGEMLQDSFYGATAWSTNLSSAEYFVRAAALDPRARQFPYPDDLLGEIIQVTATHEVGHLLGLIDGGYGKFAYSVQDARSLPFLRRMGFSPSIMNYARMNYVPQPEDNIPPSELLQRVGPADYYAMRIAYAPVKGARTALEEIPTLNEWAKVQDTDPLYRFTSALTRDHSGPDMMFEVIETTDPVTTTTLGLKNLRRAMEYMGSVQARPSENQPNISILYGAAISLWTNQMSHVVTLVGGYTRARRAGHEQRAEATPIPPAEQRRALAFLGEEAFRTPLFLNDPAVVRFLPVEPVVNEDGVTRIVNAQIQVLESLLNINRLNRLADAQGVNAVVSDAPLSLSEMLGELRKSIYIELMQPAVRIDAYRQGLQEGYISLLKKRLAAVPDKDKGPNLQIFAANAIRAELTAISVLAKAALGKAGDAVTQVHLNRLAAARS